jgi:hypothetical protein
MYIEYTPYTAPAPTPWANYSDYYSILPYTPTYLLCVHHCTPIKEINWSYKMLVEIMVYPSCSMVLVVPPSYLFLGKLTYPYMLAWLPFPLLKEIGELFL